MSKFKFKLKLQGLELEMEGSRDDIPLMAQNIGNQLAGLAQPAADMASDNSQGHSVAPLIIDHSASEKGKTKKRRKRNAAASATNGDTVAIEWQHDPTRYGNPQQSWNTAKKSIWILYVASKEAGISQLTATQIADTFNRKFKQAGTIRATNVSRDLGNAKIKNPALTGEDTAKDGVPTRGVTEGIGRRAVRLGRVGQRAATAGRLMKGSSLNCPTLSSVM